MLRWKISPILALYLSLGAPGSLVAQSPATGTVAITGATVIDGTGAAPIPDATVVVVDGRIEAVGPAGEITVPEGAGTVDGSGRWLVPGFVDAHAHVSLGPVEFDMSGPVPAPRLTVEPEIPLRTLRTLLAHGITSIRDPGGDPAQLVSLRNAVASGALVGPRMRVAGRVIDRTPFEGLVETVTNEAEIRAAVREDAKAGVDMVKLYVALEAEMLGAAVDEAHAAGIGTVAHLMTTSWTDAARLGLDHILHIVPGSPDLLPPDRRADYMEMVPRGTQFMYGWFERADFDGPEMTEMFDALAEHDVSVDPTLVIFEAMIRGDDPYFTESPDLDLAHPALVRNWRSFFTFSAGWTAADFAAGRRAWPRFLELTKRLYDKGITLSAGTDANNPWVIPGPSFHRELELLSDAGIPNLEVLKIATHNGAEVSGILAETGTIEAGKWADLVLLTGDPVEDISHSRNVEWVMQAGRSYRPDELLAGIH